MTKIGAYGIVNGEVYEVDLGTTWYEFLSQSIDDNVVNYDGLALICIGHYGSWAAPQAKYVGVAVNDGAVEGAIESQDKNMLLSLLLSCDDEITPGAYCFVDFIVGLEEEEGELNRADLSTPDWRFVKVD